MHNTSARARAEGLALALVVTPGPASSTLQALASAVSDTSQHSLARQNAEHMPRPRSALVPSHNTALHAVTCKIANRYVSLSKMTAIALHVFQSLRAVESPCSIDEDDSAAVPVHTLGNCSSPFRSSGQHQSTQSMSRTSCGDVTILARGVSLPKSGTKKRIQQQIQHKKRTRASGNGPTTSTTYYDKQPGRRYRCRSRNSGSDVPYHRGTEKNKLVYPGLDGMIPSLHCVFKEMDGSSVYFARRLLPPLRLKSSVRFNNGWFMSFLHDLRWCCHHGKNDMMLPFASPSIGEPCRITETCEERRLLPYTRT